MKSILVIIFVALIFINAQSSFGSSGYVLPYPSSMPGSFFYKPQLLFDLLKKYWYFGNFSQFEYNRQLSDKYLVEAKTLFEYNQYLLAYEALNKSDAYFQHELPYLISAKNQKKDINSKLSIFNEQLIKHIEELNSIKQNVPSVFVWQPEKSSPTVLNLHKEIEDSIKIREKK